MGKRRSSAAIAWHFAERHGSRSSIWHVFPPRVISRRLEPLPGFWPCVGTAFRGYRCRGTPGYPLEPLRGRRAGTGRSSARRTSRWERHQGRFPEPNVGIRRSVPGEGSRVGAKDELLLANLIATAGVDAVSSLPNALVSAAPRSTHPPRRDLTKSLIHSLITAPDSESHRSVTPATPNGWSLAVGG